MRVGVFGGTFDPIHHGHLVLAEQCREQGGLDQVWFIPAFRPPNKLAHSITRFDQRVEMLQLAIAGNPRFRVDQLEQDRQGPSYTADTLALLHQRHPGDEFWLLVGSDTLADIPNWYHPERVLDLAGLMVRARPGTKVMSVEELRTRLPLAPNTNIRLDVIQSPLIEISSRDLRQRASEGRTLRYFLPRAVEVYIQEKRLYQASQAGDK